MPEDKHVTTRSQVKIPKMIYGTAWKKERTTEYVQQALSAGFRGIDTACQPKHYQEELVGKAIQISAIPRSEIFIQTKFTPLPGQDPNRLPYDAKAPLETQVEQSIGASLKNLGTEYLDSLVLHSPLHSLETTLVAWRKMESFVREGQIKQLGISNCYDKRLFESLYDHVDIKPAVLQNRFYSESGYDRALRKFCQDQQIVYQSFWTLTANPHILNSRTVQKISSELDYTPAQIFFRSLIQQGIVPLTGTTNPLHMEQALACLSFTLSSEQVNDVFSLTGGSVK